MLDVSDEVSGICARVDAIPFCGRNKKSSNVFPIHADSSFGGFIGNVGAK